MQRQTLVINGHPDPRPERFCAALCEAYRGGAGSGGGLIRQVAVGALSPADANPSQELPPDMLAVRDSINWATHLVIVFPLWLDQAPAMLRRVFARLAMWNAANCASGDIPIASDRIQTVVTMEMPAFAHRSMFRDTAMLSRNRIALPGLTIAAPTFIGSVRVISDEKRTAWLGELRTRGLNRA